MCFLTVLSKVSPTVLSPHKVTFITSGDNNKVNMRYGMMTGVI